MNALRGILLLALAGCGLPGDLVVLELPLASRSVLVEIGTLRIGLYAPDTACNVLDRIDPPEDPAPIHSTDLSLTIDERANGTDRFAPNLTPGVWLVTVTALNDDDVRIGFLCQRDVELTADTTVAIEFAANTNQRAH
ncbi:MAG: hypothetical protein CMH55_03520 [Myxococcales bacterium]|nr:hypothetical protein [Myxococcales bacterium]